MSDFVFPQTEAKDENFNRTGGLTKLELFSVLFASHELALCDAFHAAGKLTDDAARNLRGHALSHGIRQAEALLEMLNARGNAWEGI